MAIQEILKERRLELGMTLAEVAYQVGISESTLSRYETSGIQNMGIDKLKKLADVLQTTPTYLMGWEVAKPNEKTGELLVEIRKSPRLLRLVEDFMKLNQAQQESVLALIHSMIPDKRL